MNLKILNYKEKTEIEEKLNEKFGIQHLPDTIIQIGKERIKLFTGNLAQKEIETIEKITSIENIGLYIAKK